MSGPVLAIVALLVLLWIVGVIIHALKVLLTLGLLVAVVLLVLGSRKDRQ